MASDILQNEVSSKEICSFFVIPPEKFREVAARFKGVVKPIDSLYPGLRYNLSTLRYPHVYEYIFAALTSSVIFGFLMLCIFVLYLITSSPNVILIFEILFGSLAITGAVFLLYLIYPSLKLRSLSAVIDRTLIYALKDMLVQIRSGVTLYDSMVNVAHSNYGAVSKEFDIAVRALSAGVPLTKALEEMSARTQSEYFKRAIWQLISALHSGASVEPALRSVIKTLAEEQESSIKKYAANMNFLVLIYMLISSSLPAMMLPFLMIMVCFTDITVNLPLLIGLLAGFGVVQLAVIGYVKTSRPSALNQ